MKARRPGQPRYERPPPVGRPLRHLMADARWPALSLSARATWAQLSVAADLVADLRTPGASPIDEAGIARLIAADPVELASAVEQLVRFQILERVADGALRLKVF